MNIYGAGRKKSNKDWNINNLYSCWYDMKKRCINKKAQNYKYYGGRGISVCERWLGKDGFKNFANDMGKRPEGTSIDRINNNGNYEPQNCRWATIKEQHKNKRLIPISLKTKERYIGLKKYYANRFSHRVTIPFEGKKIVKCFKDLQEAINFRDSVLKKIAKQIT